MWLWLDWFMSCGSLSDGFWFGRRYGFWSWVWVWPWLFFFFFLVGVGVGL